MPWLPVDTRDARKWPPVAKRPDLACTPDNAMAFYSDGSDTHYTDARTICCRCPALVECLEWALDTRQRFGFWGGATPQERTAMLGNPRLRTAALRHAAILACPE